MARVVGNAGSGAATTSDPAPYGYTARMYYGIGSVVLIIVVILVILLLLGRI